MTGDAGKTFGVIAPVLDLAAAPSRGGGGVVSQVICGDEVRGLGRKEGGAVEVAAARGTSGEEDRGWVNAEGLGEATMSWHFVVTAEALAYAEPTRRAGPPVERLPLGAGLSQRQSADRWPEGFTPVTVRERTLFIQNEDLAKHPLQAGSPEEQLRVAASLLGRPYVWGGCTSLGLDCSGLAKLLAGLAGVGLPHSAARQSRLRVPGFEAVAGLDVARPGDFIYLRPDAPGAEADHVVVWAEGGSVLHASAEGGPPAVRREPWAAVAPRGVVAAVRRLLDPA